MSGGTAYVYDTIGDIEERCNLDMITLYPLEDKAEIAEVKALIENHVKYTGSAVGEKLLANWNETVKKFVKVMPDDYAQMLSELDKAKAEGLEGEELLTTAFERKVASK